MSDWLDVVRGAVDQRLGRLLPLAQGDDGRLAEAMRYAVFGGGKRLRPAIALAAYESVGGGRDGLALDAACAVELVHVYSLVHDDLPAMDDDSLRRGRPTVHVAFDEATAILVGDALLALAFELLAVGENHEPGQLAAIATLAHAAGATGMVGGQALDLAAGASASGERLLAIQRLKTGALFAAAAEIGGHVADVPREATQRLADFGLAFGTAFQYADDLTDGDRADDSTARAAVAHHLDEARRLARSFSPRESRLLDLCDRLAPRSDPSTKDQ